MAFFDIEDYGLGRPVNLFDYTTLLDEEEERRRSNKPMIPYTGQDLSQYSPSQFDVPALPSTGGATAPVGINPSAPAENQPPTVDIPTSAPMTAQNKYERMEGVTNSDRLAALGMSMSAIGTSDFNRIYGASNAALIQKQKEADEYNMKLDAATKGSIEWQNGVAYRMPPSLIKNNDGTYSVNEKAGSPVRIEGTGKISELARLAGIPEDEAAILAEMSGDNKDTAMGYIYAKAFEGFEGSLQDYIQSPLNANKPAASVAFDRNFKIFSDTMPEDEAMRLAQLYANGGVETKVLSTGEILAVDKAGNTHTIRGLDDAIKFGEQAQRALQESEDEVGQYDSIVTSAREKLDTNAEEYRNQSRGLRVLDRWEEKIRNMSEAEFDEIFGWGNQLMYDFFGKGHPTLTALNSATTYEGLQTLANEANLAPVSNLEFTKVGGLLGSGKLESKEQLLELFEEARFRTNDKINRIMRDDEYYLYRLQEVPNDRWYKMYSRRPYMTAEETLREAQNVGR